MLPKTKMETTPIENPSLSDSQPVIDRTLPQDLITEILIYLPVKSLVKFKCVSKPWLSLISSSQFIKSHFATSSREGQYSNHQLLFTIPAPNSGMKHCSLSAALHNPSTNVSDIEYPSPNPKVSPRIVGIINGLVCLATGGGELYLWNPILRKSKHLPRLNFSRKDCRLLGYGFGYNESNDDYKVVMVTWVYSSGGDYELKVYSLRTDSWRRIEGFKAGQPIGDGTYANGKIWWTSWTAGGNRKIVSLDMVGDKYEEVQGPVHEGSANDWVVTVLGGRLYVLCYYLEEKADLWVMNKFGVDKSWSKVLSVPDNDVNDPAKPYTMKHVLCISRNSEIVLEDVLGGGLLVYSSKDKIFKKIQLGGLRWFSQVFVYAESLLSPNGKLSEGVASVISST